MDTAGSRAKPSATQARRSTGEQRLSRIPDKPTVTGNYRRKRQPPPPIIPDFSKRASPSCAASRPQHHPEGWAGKGDKLAQIRGQAQNWGLAQITEKSWDKPLSPQLFLVIRLLPHLCRLSSSWPGDSRVPAHCSTQQIYIATRAGWYQRGSVINKSKAL